MERFTIGVDFGTESGRAVLVRLSDGVEIAAAIHPYENGVIDQRLPIDAADPLPPDWALQDPDDYIRTLQHAIPEVLRVSTVDPKAVVGLGVDFTSCTMLPTLADGTPLS